MKKIKFRLIPYENLEGEYYDVIGYDGYSVGIVEYYKKWKTWTFEPMNDTLYDSKCLIEISDFLKIRNNT